MVLFICATYIHWINGGSILSDTRYGVNAVRDLLNRHGFKFSKTMGQNFLIDANIPEKIVRLSVIDESCGVLEVGPGIGSMTLTLSKAAGRVVAVELDRRLEPILHETLAGHTNVEVVRGDILRLDIRKLVDEKMPGLRSVACANLPYNITTPALTALINARVFKSIAVMVQREVARRICAKPGTAEYGAFTVYVNYNTEPKILFDVPPECFMPKPRVHSSVLVMTPRAVRLLEPEEESLFFKTTRAAFGQRRKTLVNALYAVFGSTLSKEEIVRIVKKCGYDERVRGEMLSIEDFTNLSSFMKSV